MSEPATATRLDVAVVEEIRAMLARRRTSATELARRLGWTQSYLARRMNGRPPIDLDDLERIANALGVTIVDLLPRDRRDVTSSYPKTRPVDNRPPAAHRPPSGPGRTARLRRPVFAA